MKVDWLGAALLFSCVSALLIALGADAAVPWAATALALFAAFVIVERRQASRFCRWTCWRIPSFLAPLGGVLVGVALFGAIAFVPLYVQVVLGGSATEAGQVLTPLFSAG